MPSKYDRCVKAVTKKQPASCATKKAWGKNTAGCYNPWAVCARLKVHTGPRGGKYTLVKGKKKYIKSINFQ